MVNSDGSGQHKIGNNKTKSSPFAIPLASHGEVYFQGTDDALWKVNADGTNQHKVGNNKTQSAVDRQREAKSRPFVILPAVGLQPRVYFQGTDDKLWGVNSDGKRRQLSELIRMARVPSPSSKNGVRGTEAYRNRGARQVQVAPCWPLHAF